MMQYTCMYFTKFHALSIFTEILSQHQEETPAVGFVSHVYMHQRISTPGASITDIHVVLTCTYDIPAHLHEYLAN